MKRSVTVFVLSAVSALSLASAADYKCDGSNCHYEFDVVVDGQVQTIQRNASSWTILSTSAGYRLTGNSWTLVPGT